MDQSGGLYAKLEERILARDQIGASAVYYDLVRAERPRAEIVGETVRIHAPYTHVPYHQRIDDGFVRFVNNDHCLLSARTSLRLPKLLAPALEYLPLAQTIWYVPTGLDPWNQLLGKMPGHYGGRGQKRDPNKPIAPPERHWPDQRPVALDGPFEERLNHWVTLVQRGDVLEAYRVFLGLFEERERRPELLAHLAFAGLIDVQDRMLYNRSYTTGHKAHRARATIEIGEAVGWDAAHDVLYAGALDMAVGPRWHSAYEMACQVSWMHLAEDDAKVKSSMEPSPKKLIEARLLANSAPLTPAEAQRLQQALLEEPEPAYIHEITTRLPAGALLARLDEAQVALKPDESVAWTRAYLDAGHDRAPLASTLALAAVKEGNDPHNQEIGLGLVEDWASSTAHDRDTLLLACAHHTAGHQKFGDPLECYRRFTEAFPR